MTKEEMFDWLAGLQCNSFTLARDDDHACNYATARQWIEEYGDARDWEGVNPEELNAMKDQNTIWKLQIYPATPIGFCIWYGVSMESVVSKAMEAWPEISRGYQLEAGK
jgi:hypothetical protein